ncbi:hypothetical protein GALMADRAFT_315338 [Galerina marginata CBS 339.88]|uniref:Uncharacterized protein n=1 Tax=Galerina marginata (strain CBS 339.88) TaxID=685588 RepID=A0A067TRW5_GALM3|nr:hypothetical protein GALMADRAFT_315338 [Galerina marginata CBS 339.88]
MFIHSPRTDDEGDACPSGHVYCAPSGSGSGGNTTTASSNSSDSLSGNSGMHRFIGIAMVIVMVLLAAAAWLYYAKVTKKRKRAGGSSWSSYLCCGRWKKSAPTIPGDNNSEAPLDMLGKPKMEDAKTPITYVSEKERSMMLQAEPRGLIKEVSGGIVIYTEPPRAAALPGRDRYPAAVDSNRGFERVHGVRFEVISIFVEFITTPSPSWEESIYTTWNTWSIMITTEDLERTDEGFQQSRSRRITGRSVNEHKLLFRHICTIAIYRLSFLHRCSSATVGSGSEEPSHCKKG